MNEPLNVERHGAVAWLTLNRPAAGNTIDVALAEALGAAVAECARDTALRALVITGAGALFCGGGDIRAFTAGDSAAAAIDAITSRLHPAIECLATMPKPIVTLVNGPAAGAGLGLALIGDIVIAARSAHFTSAYTAIGLTPDGGTSWLLPRLIGLRRASEMVITNRRVGAEEAERIGLVTRVVDDHQLADEGAQTANRLADSAIGALTSARHLLATSPGRGLADHLALEARTIAQSAGGAEGREGIASFLERRPPRFDGL
ncbi:MAG: enoyl-CoA hydratase/isomerase family protein [Sphingomicrobium sp.]